MLKVTITTHMDAIVLQSFDSEYYSINAESIFAYIKDGKKEINETYVIEKEDLNGLSFADIPLSLTIKLYNNNGEIILALADENNGYLKTSGSIDLSSENCIVDHAIIDGTWYPFVRDDIKLLNNILSNYEIDNLGEISLGNYLNLRKQSNEIFEIIDEVTPQDISELNLFKEIDNIEGLHAELYDYQKIGVRWLNAIVHENLGGILADEMGLGKTLQIIGAMLCNRNADEPHLVVVRATLLENWRRELKKFAPEFKVLVHHGSDRTGNYKTFFDYDVVITSYGSIVRDLPIFKMLKWNIVSLDEAQDIKNPSAKRTQKIKQLERNSSISITGTPLENTLLDLWSIMDFSYSGYLGSKREFEEVYMMSEREQVSLEPVIRPLMLKREVSEVADQLPERIDIPVYLTMHASRKEMYHSIRERIREQYSGSPSLAAITALRQFCCHPHILDELLYYHIDECSAKYNHLIQILEQIIIRNEKLLIFSSYTKMIDMLVSDVANRFNIWTNRIDGQVKLDSRQPLIDEFSEIGGSALLVLNPKAGGAGLNITAANHVIHYNPEWNPATEDQASARAYRLGQDKPVTIHRFIYADTVEDVMDMRLARKRNLAEQVVVRTRGEDARDLELILGIE